MESAVLQIFTIVFLGFYCVVLHSFRRPDEENKQLRERFVGMALVLCALTFGLAAGKLMTGGGVVGGSVVGDAAWLPLAVVFGVGLLAAAVVVVQTGVLRAVGALTFSGEVAERMVEIKKNSLATLALLLAPPVMLFTGANPVRDKILVWAVCVVIVATVGVFVARTLRLFLKQKISLLIWILYLCTVEILPIVTLAVAARGSFAVFWCSF